MIAALKKWLTISLFLGLAGFLLYYGYLYYGLRNALPVGATMAGLDVAGLSLEEAGELITRHYAAPVAVYYMDERVEIDPKDVYFILDVDSMLDEAEQQWVQQEWWWGYLAYLLNQPLQPIEIPLRATHERAALVQMLQMVAKFLDRPARPPQMLPDTAGLREGQPGFTADLEASLAIVEAAFYQPRQREAHLVIIEEEAPSLSMQVLADVIMGQLQSFNGMGSIFVMDLQTGEEISINGDVALSGTSVLKIAIFLEAYRALNGPPNEYQEQLFYDAAVRSSNYAANLLLHVAAGQDNTYRGADILTESMKRLGLHNTFIAVPYGATPPAHRQTTYVTPANSRTDISTRPDPTMQTTAEEIGTLLSMIYYCARGGGALLALYPDQLAPQECQAIIDLMVLNEEGNLIRFGVPTGVPVSHKHGWALATHADAGLVLSPGGDYVLVEYLYQPGDWLEPDVSFPILREISRAVYNYFNFDDPYLGDALFERERFDPDDPFFQELDEAEASEEPESDAAEQPDSEPSQDGATLGGS